MKKFSGRAVRTALLVLPVLLLSALFAFTSVAGASVTPTFSLSLDDTKLGAHSTTRVNLGFDYGGPDPALYPDGNWRESVSGLVVDIPAGLVGNPNAIPMADRCDPAQFETAKCPVSSDVGTIEVTATLLMSELDGTDLPPMPGDAYGTFVLKYSATSAKTTRLSLLKPAATSNGQEVPATIGIYIPPVLNGLPAVRQKISISPEVNSVFKLRTVTTEPVVHKLYDPAQPDQPENEVPYLRIDAMKINFLGTLANGNAFMTNPTRCEVWTSTAYTNAYYDNNNLSADPFGRGVNDHNSASSSIIPDCTNQTSVPFPISGTTAISTKSRDISPDFDFTITEPGLQANGQASSTPRKIVTTVPASINVDVQQLGRLCQEEQFVADKCADSTKVGTVAIETPLIVAGLTGDVYLVRNPKLTLPDLGLRIRGAINFTQRGANRYVGVKGNQIETTFDNIPEVGFSKLNVHLVGGPNGLLRTLACPTNNKQPRDGNFTYNFTAYSGATTSSTTNLNVSNCFGIQKLRTFKCVYRVLRFQPTYTSRARIKRVVLYVDGKKVSTAKRVPFQFRVNAKRFKKGKHKFTLKATYDDGTVSVKKSRFRRC